MKLLMVATMRKKDMNLTAEEDREYGVQAHSQWAERASGGREEVWEERRSGLSAGELSLGFSQ